MHQQQAQLQFTSAARHKGIQARAMVRTLVKRMSLLVPLVLVLKQLLAQTGLNNAFQGGLSSFALVMMVVNFLQVIEHAYIYRHIRTRTHAMHAAVLVLRQLMFFSILAHVFFFAYFYFFSPLLAYVFFFFPFTATRTRAFCRRVLK